jgi:hypothetical protein
MERVKVEAGRKWEEACLCLGAEGSKARNKNEGRMSVGKERR